MSSVPKFLLGGIRFGKNFIGKETLQTSSYTVLECSVKVLPIFWLIGGNSSRAVNCVFRNWLHHACQLAA